MIVLVAKYHVRPGNAHAVADALTRMASLVAKREPGCRLYHASRSTQAPELFLLYELYEDEAALLAHRETPHFKEIIEDEVLPLLNKRERETYELTAAVP